MLFNALVCYTRQCTYAAVIIIKQSVKEHGSLVLFSIRYPATKEQKCESWRLHIKVPLYFPHGLHVSSRQYFTPVWSHPGCEGCHNGAAPNHRSQKERCVARLPNLGAFSLNRIFWISVLLNGRDLLKTTVQSSQLNVLDTCLPAVDI